MFSDPRITLPVLFATVVTILVIMVTGCGVTVESEPIEAHAEERGCVSSYECSNRQVEILEEIRDLDKKILERQGNY